MRPSVASHASRPLPSDVKRRILSFCDVGTLCASSRVSLAFLELVGPILYKDIIIKGNKQIVKMAGMNVRKLLPSDIVSHV